MTIHIILSVTIITLGFINLFRMTWFLIGADVYEIRRHLASKHSKKTKYIPFVSVVIPAYNEERSNHRSLESLIKQTYNHKKYEIIVINDGSNDNTSSIVQTYIDRNPKTDIHLVEQPNSGKANALNNGMKNYAKGEIVVCLDADSAFAPDAIKNAVKYFEDTKVVALPSNVKILPGSGFLNLVQQFEFLISYQMKRAQTVCNIEYIVGGVGSFFRKKILEKINYYDTDTITEDIDMTMKILQLGNKDHRIVYGADVIAYTESVHTVHELIKQRFRWKWGRCQTFFKNKNMFFKRDIATNPLLTWFYLPYAIVSDILFIIEPIMIGYILYMSASFGDPTTIISALLVITTYISFSIWGETSLSFIDKVQFTMLTPAMYVLFYIMTYIEYIALMKTLIKLPSLKSSVEKKECHWTHVERAK